MISEYNKSGEDRYPIRNLTQIIGKRLVVRGFIVGDPDMGPKYSEEHQQNCQKWLKEGSLKANMHVVQGIENGPDGLVGLFEGRNFGKAVLEIAPL